MTHKHEVETLLTSWLGILPRLRLSINTSGWRRSSWRPLTGQCSQSSSLRKKTGEENKPFKNDLFKSTPMNCPVCYYKSSACFSFLLLPHLFLPSSLFPSFLHSFLPSFSHTEYKAQFPSHKTPSKKMHPRALCP